MACLVCLLLLAVRMDLRSYKISNHLILIGIITGFLFDVYEYGQAGISLWLPGILLPVILLFPLFIIKALGAGDIKLFSVIGSFYGAAYVLKSIAAYTFFYRSYRCRFTADNLSVFMTGHMKLIKERSRT